MAAHLKMSVEEALKEILGDKVGKKPETKENAEEKIKKIMESGLEKMACDEGFNADFFLSASVKALVPIFHLSRDRVQQENGLAANILTRYPIWPSTLLHRESKLWLQCIHRRLCGRRGIRQPFHGEIVRDIPYEIFAVMTKVVRGMEGFAEPFGFYSNNRKAEVISFTSVRLLSELFVLLSGLGDKDIATYFKRNLATGMRRGNMVSVLVSDEKDFAFLYKINQGKLVISFNFGEWNAHGFPQHT